MPDSVVHQISVADRAKIESLMRVIDCAQNEVAKALGPYLGFKDAKVVDHTAHQRRAEVSRAAEVKKKLIAVIYSEDGRYGCYYDPPGICELCE
jgi:hypothetical protein